MTALNLCVIELLPLARKVILVRKWSRYLNFTIFSTIDTKEIQTLPKFNPLPSVARIFGRVLLIIRFYDKKGSLKKISMSAGSMSR